MKYSRYPVFKHYIGIDYSGAETPDEGLPGLRVYRAERERAPDEVPPQGRYWSRKELSHWLAKFLKKSGPALVGIDHGFSFPLKYFEKYGLPRDWGFFLEDFNRHWPTDSDNMYVDFIREGEYGNGAARMGDARWRRLAELRTKRAKSVFHFDVPGQVAKSTFAGLPWLRFLRGELRDRIHFWPFDGWELPKRKSVIAEVYPSLWRRNFDQGDRTQDEHDAWSVAQWLRSVDLDGSLERYLKPELSDAEREIARIEGWILGIE